MRYVGILVVVSLIIWLLLAPLRLTTAPPAEQALDCRVFIATHQSICGRFLSYWNSFGQLEEQGYPLSAEIQESRGDKMYTVQYFERSVFEYHPENMPPNDVQLTLLGTIRYEKKYPSGAPNQQASSENSRFFKETHMYLGGRFRVYWEEHGGVHQWGYPISDEFDERSELDGVAYKVQYFQRAVFEYHPTNDPAHQVLLKPLGAISYNSKLNIALLPAPTVSSARP